MKHLIPLLLAILCLPAEARPRQAAEGLLYKKCDSEIPWITDGIELVDNLVGGRRPEEPAVDRAALLDKALKLAAERNRLVLWYCFRVPGTHMYRARLLDQYMRAAIFTDPAVTDLVRAKFVPLRMAGDNPSGFPRGIKPFDFVEPGIIILTPDGKVVHSINRIRTFNPAWVRTALVAVLRKNEAFNAPAGDSLEDLLRGGDDEKALEKASPGQKALILRRAGRHEEVLKLDGPPLQKGLALLALGKLDEARGILEKEGSPEAAYHLAAIDLWSRRDPGPRWRALVEKAPESPWAWRAAANLVRGPDTRPDGPLANYFEDLLHRPIEAPPASTRLPGADVEGTARRALEFLLRAQRPDGSWSDARYAYWPDPRIQPNTFMAVTAAAALALSEWRALDPARIGAAPARAEEHLDDDRRMNRGQNEECYADAYRILYWASKKDVPRMNRLVVRLAAQQDKDGFWAHEYPNPFATAGVVHALDAARKAGAAVPAALFSKAAVALLKTRGEGGRQAYMNNPPASSAKDSAGRIPLCEMALHECGKGSIENVAAGLENYWKHRDRIDNVRVCDFHSDGELAGFFYFHNLFHATEAARALGEPGRGEHLRKLREQVLTLPEIDGSFNASHPLGDRCATPTALLVMCRTR